MPCACGPLLAHADLILDASGQPASALYGDVYASRAGALGQARAVYLSGCGLLDTPARWAGRRQFTVLETGFGLGVNFLATWAAWRADPQRCARLDYVALELHPVRAADLLAHAPPALRHLAAVLAAHWPPPVRGVHVIVLEGEGVGPRPAALAREPLGMQDLPHANSQEPTPPHTVTLYLAFGDAQDLARRLRLAADALYLDGFAPAKNPQMWEPALLRALARLAKPGALAASYTVAGAVQRALRDAGFDVGLHPGWAGKRQRLQATFNPRWRRSRCSPPAAWRDDLPRHAVIIGAGISGAACAHALARRGWSVEVLEAGDAPAGGGSALPAGLAHLQPSADDNALSRLTRAAMAALRRALPLQADDIAVFGAALLSPADAADARRMAQWQHSVRLPPQMAQRADSGWLVDAAVLANQAVCAAWLDAPRITLRCRTQAATLQRDGDFWTVRDAAGSVLARAPQVVLASALHTPQLLCASGLIPDAVWLPLHALRGQAQALPARLWPALQRLARPWMGRGYVLRLPPAAVRALQPAPDPDDGDWLLIGATFETEGSPLSAEQAWARNRAGLAALTRQPPLPAHTAALRHFAGVRAASIDRLPYCGPLPDLAALLADPQRAAGWQLFELPRLPGLAVCTGMGSRGLTLAALLAEVLAAQIEGSPLPLETDLANALDPARVALRRLRRAASAPGSVAAPPHR
jgi:tRNA 5-methylaminomethyl-2-thiouridine biosynthesis bifunctional protein